MLTKVGEGKYREVYRIGNEVVKVLKPTIIKEYGPISLKFPTQIYTKYKFGIEDFNIEEFRNYFSFAGRIPSNLKENFAKILNIIQNEGKTNLICELVSNSDGNISRCLEEHGKINDNSFWKKMLEIEKFMLEERVYLLDIGGKNIVVRENNGVPSPVLIDYKCLGKRAFPFQLSVLTEGLMRNKLERRFDRLRKAHN